MGAVFIVSNQTNPYLNLAVEQFLVEHAEGVVLYLWRNRRTVVIGQNQNPYSEVNLEALAADGGHLMRRLTGGGAVYHDDGNLNFSFVAPKDLYDRGRQFAVIQRAVESYGIATELSGRNDILAEGRKFSGNAFSKGLRNDLHHGTLLVGGDMNALGHYLRPRPDKLLKHGVQSVRSRVVNLVDLCPSITVEGLSARLREAFEAEYCTDMEHVGFETVASHPEVLSACSRLASDEWLYGRWRSFVAKRSGRFEWGGVEVDFKVEDGTIADVQIASDCLDLKALDLAKHLLIGSTVSAAPSTDDPVASDIIALVYS